MHKSKRAWQAATGSLVLELPNAASKPLMMPASEEILWFMSKDSRAADPTISAAREAMVGDLKVRRAGRRERMGLVREFRSLFRHFLIKGRRELGFGDDRAASTTAKAASSLMSSDSGFLFLLLQCFFIFVQKTRDLTNSNKRPFVALLILFV